MKNLSTVSEIQDYFQKFPPNMVDRYATLLEKAQNTQNYELAQMLMDAAKPFLTESPVLNLWHRYTRGYLAVVLAQAPAKAIVHFESLMQEKNDPPPNLAKKALMGLGLACEMNEQWDKALLAYYQLLDYCELDKDHLTQGKALTNLAILHYKGMDYQQALNCSQKSIALLQMESNNEAWQLPLGRAWNELGMGHKALDQLEEASIAFKHYLSICATWDYRAGEGIAYNNLAETSLRLSKIRQAEDYYNLAREICLEIGNSFEAAEATFGLAKTSILKEAPPEQIQQQLDEALLAAQETNNHEIITQIYLSRADMAEKADDLTTALIETRHAVNTVESLRANIRETGTRIRLQGSRIEAYEKMVARLCQTPSGYAEAFFFAEMAKSRALIESLATPPLEAPDNIPTEWLEQEVEIRQTLNQLYNNDYSTSTEIALLEAKLNQLHQRIRLHNAEFESFYSVSPLTLKEVMTRMPPDTLLLEFFTSGDTILAFVISNITFEVVTLSLSMSALKRAFSRLDDGKYGQLSHLLPDQNQQLHHPWILEKLNQSLLDPLGENIWSTPLLCIVPHGPLHYIPFGALYRQTPNGKQYLLNHNGKPRQIVYAPSATTLFDYCQQKPKSEQGGSLALGYNGQTLSEAESEAEAVADITNGVSRQGQEATRAFLLEDKGPYRFIHLSCHARFNSAWPTASYLELADGQLNVIDILRNLRLQAELVTLSACETGQSHIQRGDELVGLVRAFLYAGTPSVLVSRWPVDELSTRLLMERFYLELVKQNNSSMVGTKARALSKAKDFLKTLTYSELGSLLISQSTPIEQVNQQLEALAHRTGNSPWKDLSGEERPFEHPYYWAPFFLVGDRL